MMTAQPSAGSHRPNLAAELPARIDRIIGARYGASVTEWAVVAATALKDQLTDNSGLPHRYITDHLALELGFEPREVEVIGDMLDVLQVSFDCADNVADREDDLLAGRNYAAAYESVPLAVLTYLPAILASHAVDLLYRNFSRPGFAPAYASQRLADVLDHMLQGQAETAPASRIDLLAGYQALLLCLPVWIRDADGAQRECQRRFEAWAFHFGRTWELCQIFRETRDMRSLVEWRHELGVVRAQWPTFSSFGISGPLSSFDLLPTLL